MDSSKFVSNPLPVIFKSCCSQFETDADIDVFNVQVLLFWFVDSLLLVSNSLPDILSFKSVVLALQVKSDFEIGLFNVQVWELSLMDSSKFVSNPLPVIFKSCCSQFETDADIDVFNVQVLLFWFVDSLLLVSNSLPDILFVSISLQDILISWGSQSVAGKRALNSHVLAE